MRFRSFLAVLVLAIAGLGFTGCGSSSSSDFVATGGPVDGGPTSGELVFNFITAQAPFVVDANTAELQFDFYNGVDADPVFSTTRDFDSTIVIGGVPVAATQVVITGFDANGIPLFTITQSIQVVGGETTTVDGINSPVAVTLVDLILISGSVFDADQELTTVEVPLDATTQVFLFAEYSNGSLVLLGDQATYTVVDTNIATVSSFGTVSGLSVGTTTLLAQFQGQTLNRSLIVNDGSLLTLSGISVSPNPVEVSAGNPATVVVSGTRASDGQSFSGLTANLTYAVDDQANFAVSPGGEVSVVGTPASGTSTTLTASYTNPDNSTVSGTTTVTVP